LKHLLAIFALIALAFAPVTTFAQAGPCHCPSMMAMQVSGAPHAKAPPCCPHGKGCAKVCAPLSIATAVLPMTDATGRMEFAVARLIAPADVFPRSADRRAEAPPPKPVA
jgi:hypothetical protein